MKKTVAVILLLMLTLSQAKADSPFGASSVLGGGLDDGLGETPQILPVDQAFRFGSYRDGETIKAFWQILPGYYLYRDKIVFESKEKRLPIELPRGKLRNDEIFGEVEVLSGLIEVELENIGPDQSLMVGYQGCAAQGYCYPPQKKSLNTEK